MMPFEYSRISKAFIEGLVDSVRSGQSIVLLGPRYGGKRHVMFRLRRLLNDGETTPIAQVRFLAEAPIATVKQAVSLISQAVAETDPDLATNEEVDGHLFGPIDRLWDKSQTPLTLFAANIDSLAHHLARRFLAGVRTRVESGQVVAVLSGEDDLRDLVHGPNSEFACANQFVLQGYERDEFEDYLDRYVRHLGFQFESFRDAADRIWTITGGNTYTIRLVLWDLLETRARSDTPVEHPVKTSDIRDSLKMIGIPGIYGSHVFRHAIELIARDPDCWDQLQMLIERQPVWVGFRDYAPGRLELAGIAFRELANHPPQLRFTSPLMQQFITHYYDNRRLGDLYASVGQWSEAFEKYASLDAEARMRPSGANDRAEVGATVNVFCAALYSEATKGIDSVKELFVRGCRFVLGFPEITFWYHNVWERGGCWQLQNPADTDLSESVTAEISGLLASSGTNLSPGVFPVPDSFDKYCIAAILPALRSDQRVAIVVSDLQRRAVISRERERLLEQMIRHFVEAYSHAVSVDGLQIRLRVRDKHVEIINSIFDALGRSVLDVEHVIKMAARGLRQLEYRRALFCLVDPERRRIRGVLDDSEDTHLNVAEMTDWLLDDPMADLQPYVVYTGKPMIVDDASLEPLANKSVVQQAQMKAEAIVPILNTINEAIGTIHVEREDNLVPSLDEVNDLLAFGRQLAVAIAQSERVNLLQSALDKIPEPIVIVGRNDCPRYANRPAAALFDLEEGWLEPGVTPDLLSESNEEILRLIRDSFNTERRVARHIAGIGSHPEYRGAALSDVIRDWRGVIVGGLVHIQDLNYLYRVIEAFGLIAEATDTASAISSVLDAAQLLGPKWGRLYLVDPSQPDRFVSKSSFGFSDPQVQEEFNRGEMMLPSRNEPGHEHWRSIDQGEPVVFCWKSELPEEQEVVTWFGLKAVNVNPAKSPKSVKKKDGDFWIDFPLVTRNEVLGKVCLECNENVMRPEDFELLKVLSSTAAGLLDASLRRDNEFKKLIAVMAHNIDTRLGVLPMVLHKYRACETGNGEIRELNDEFSEIVAETMKTVRRAKERLGPLVPKLSSVDVISHLRQILRSTLPEGAWKVESSLSPQVASIDVNMFQTAMLELIQNSREMSSEYDQLRVSVSVERFWQGESQEWIRLLYVDNGPGVPDDLRERIFEDFFSRRPHIDTGLGLGMGYVRRVFESHNGSVVAQSAEAGAQFLIVFPASPSRKG